LDVMPDAIPIVGLADDMAVLVYVLKKVWSLVSDEAREKAKNKMLQWFDEDEMKDVDTIIDDKEQYTEG
ncbi:MAG: DUF1232 domain-containing protein, partial [Prevotella sp.]|nr:DUF1232 domain-containing protein [Prevotella sp.]